MLIDEHTGELQDDGRTFEVFADYRRGGVHMTPGQAFGNINKWLTPPGASKKAKDLAAEIAALEPREDAREVFKDEVTRELIANSTPDPEAEAAAADALIEPQPPRKITATPWRWVGPATIPPRPWIYDNHYIRGYATATVAPTKVGKSSMILVECVAMATGRALLGVKPGEPRRVWYYNGEDPLKEIDLRLAVVCKHFNVTEEDLGGRLFVDSGRKQRLILASSATVNGTKIFEPVVKDLIEELKARQIDVFVINPFVKCHEVPENDNGAIDRVMREFAGIAEIADASIELVHHTRKSNGQGEFTIEDARGGSSFISAVRSVRVCNTMTVKEMGTLGVSDDIQRRLTFRIDRGSNMAPPSAGHAVWRRLISVQVGNGDSVGVATLWVPPSGPSATPAQILAVQNRITSEGQQWRKDERAQDWIGVLIAEVMDLDLNRPEHKAQVRQIIRGWLERRLIKEVDGGQNQGRKACKKIGVDKPVEFDGTPN
jgi:hypothetical protein